MTPSVEHAGQGWVAPGILRPVTDDPQRSQPRWWQRTLPLVGMVVVLLAVASLLSSTVREQIGLSVSRERTSYVELFFATSDGAPGGAAAACRASGGRATYGFALVSHLEERQRVGYTVEVTPLRRGAFAARTRDGVREHGTRKDGLRHRRRAGPCPRRLPADRHAAPLRRPDDPRPLPPRARLSAAAHASRPGRAALPA